MKFKYAIYSLITLNTTNHISMKNKQNIVIIKNYKNNHLN